MSFKRFLSLASAIALASCMTIACDEETTQTPDDQPNTDTNVNQGYAENCQKTATPDWTKKTATKSEIVDYLVSICRLGESFDTPAFVDKAKEDQTIGSECFCYGRWCEMVGYERPEQQVTPDKLDDGSNNPDVYGNIYGCDGVNDYMGAQKSCFRTSVVEDIEPKIYFPNGTCALAMSKCTPDETTPEAENSICSFAKFGDYSKKDSFTTCPDMKEVLIDFVMNVEVKGVGAKAKLDIRACFQGCKTDADCAAVGIYDPIAEATSQTKCMIVGNEAGESAGVCFDPRTIAGVEEETKLVHAGIWAAE